MVTECTAASTAGTSASTRTGLDCTDIPGYCRRALALPVSQAYLDGELCALSGGPTSFSAMQAATDARSTDGLVLVLFDLLFLDGEDLAGEPLRVRKERLEALLASAPPGLHTANIIVWAARAFIARPATLGSRASSKRLDCPYRPGDRGVCAGSSA